jgi:hypothetical protein
VAPCWIVADDDAASTADAAAAGSATTPLLGYCLVRFSFVAAEKPIVNASFKQTSGGQTVA